MRPSDMRHRRRLARTEQCKSGEKPLFSSCRHLVSSASIASEQKAAERGENQYVTDANQRLTRDIAVATGGKVDDNSSEDDWRLSLDMTVCRVPTSRLSQPVDSLPAREADTPPAVPPRKRRRHPPYYGRSVSCFATITSGDCNLDTNVSLSLHTEAATATVHDYLELVDNPVRQPS